MKDVTSQPCGLTPDMTCLIVAVLARGVHGLEDQQQRPAVLRVELVLELGERRDAHRERFLGARLVLGAEVERVAGSTSLRRKPRPSVTRKGFAKLRALLIELLRLHVRVSFAFSLRADSFRRIPRWVLRIASGLAPRARPPRRGPRTAGMDLRPPSSRKTIDPPDVPAMGPRSIRAPARPASARDRVFGGSCSRSVRAKGDLGEQQTRGNRRRDRAPGGRFLLEPQDGRRLGQAGGLHEISKRGPGKTTDRSRIPSGRGASRASSKTSSASAASGGRTTSRICGSRFTGGSPSTRTSSPTARPGAMAGGPTGECPT